MKSLMEDGTPAALGAVVAERRQDVACGEPVKSYAAHAADYDKTYASKTGTCCKLYYIKLF